MEYEYTADADPGTTEDLINELGGTYSITLVVDGTYHWQLTVSGSTQTESGTFEVSGNQLILTPDSGTPTAYRFTFDQIFMTLHDDGVSYDFGGGVEPASLRIRLDRF